MQFTLAITMVTIRINLRNIYLEFSQKEKTNTIQKCFHYFMYPFHGKSWASSCHLSNDIHLSTWSYWHKGNMKTFHKGQQGYINTGADRDIVALNFLVAICFIFKGTQCTIRTDQTLTLKLLATLVLVVQGRVLSDLRVDWAR